MFLGGNPLFGVSAGRSHGGGEGRRGERRGCGARRRDGGGAGSRSGGRSVLYGRRGRRGYRGRMFTRLVGPTGVRAAGCRAGEPGCGVCRCFRGGAGPAHRAYRGRSTPFRRAVRRTSGGAFRCCRRVLAGCEPVAPAARSAVVGRRGGRSVHGVPRLEHLSVGLRTSEAGRCLLPPWTVSFPSLSRPTRPHSTRIPAPYGQVRRECDIGRSDSHRASHPPARFRRIPGNAGLRSLRPVRLHCPALPHTGQGVPSRMRTGLDPTGHCRAHKSPLHSSRMRARRESPSPSTMRPESPVQRPDRTPGVLTCFT